MKEDYQPYYDNWGQVQFPTEEEAEYPPGLAEAYAKGLAAYFEQEQLWPEDKTFRQGSFLH